MRLQVVMINDQRRMLGQSYEGELYPLDKRLVSIDLTSEQVALLTPRKIGEGHFYASMRGRPDRYEVRGDVWL